MGLTYGSVLHLRCNHCGEVTTVASWMLKMVQAMGAQCVKCWLAGTPAPLALLEAN